MPSKTLSAWKGSIIDIIIIEDGGAIKRELTTFLSNTKIIIRGISAIDSLYGELRIRQPDILIIDMDLLGENGYSICRRMRSTFVEMGIVILAIRSSPADRIVGYQSGADFYLIKPANFFELEAILINLSRRVKNQIGGKYQLDVSRGVLTISSNEKILLTRMESRLLQELALSADRRLSTSDLVEKLYGESFEFKNTGYLPVLISRLRRKINDKNEGNFIKAIRGYGYQLNITIILKR